MIKEFIVLYFFNLLFDYPLQGTFLAEGKKYSLYLLWVHSAIWGFGLSIVLIFFGIFSLWKLVFLVCGHFVIDFWKARELYGRLLTGNQALYVDQSLHILQIALCLI